MSMQRNREKIVDNFQVFVEKLRNKQQGKCKSKKIEKTVLTFFRSISFVIKQSKVNFEKDDD